MTLFPRPRRRRPTLRAQTPLPPIYGPYAHPDGGPGPYWEDADGQPAIPITGAAAAALRRQAMEHRP